MNKLHEAYLNLGSNIEPESHLQKAIELLRTYGIVIAISTVWESHAVGESGPNFLNVCVLFKTKTTVKLLKSSVIRPIEAQLGRVRSTDKNAPRTIDIDIVIFDGQLLRPEYWDTIYTVVPLAELNPNFEHPQTHEKLSQAAQQLRASTWIQSRADISIPIQQQNI